jgi:hypothetical protein
VFYFSQAVSKVQLFIEFFFELMHERVEPLLVVIEIGKVLLKLREYRLLVGHEKINTYIDMDAYQEMKRLKEIRDAHFTLVRSQKTLPKIKNFKPSAKLQQLKKGAAQSVDAPVELNQESSSGGETGDSSSPVAQNRRGGSIV